MLKKNSKNVPKDVLGAILDPPATYILNLGLFGRNRVLGGEMKTTLKTALLMLDSTKFRVYSLSELFMTLIR